MEDITPKVIAGERRLTILLMGYWQETRGDRRCPLVHAFKRAIPTDILADCFVFLPAETPGDGRLHDIGAALARNSGIAAASLVLSEVPHDTLIGTAAKWLDRVLEQASPVVDEGEYRDQEGNRNHYRATLLPLEDKKGEIIQVLGGARRKAG